MAESFEIELEGIDKGRLLEIIVADLERSLEGSSEVQITTRAKVKDRDGCDREIDVLVQFEANKKKMQIAIECKNIKGPVKMSHIDEFYNKISNHGIKGVFLTTSKYQQNAKAKANNCGIELYCIEKSGVGLGEHLEIYNRRYAILNVNFPHLQNLSEVKLDKEHIYYGDKKLKYPISEYTKKHLYPLLVKSFEENSKILFAKFFEAKQNRIDEIYSKSMYGIKAIVRYAFYKVNEEFIPVEEIEVATNIWIEREIHENLNTLCYKSMSENKDLSHFLFKGIQMNNDKLGLLTFKLDPAGGVPKVSVIPDIKNASQFYDLKLLATIEPEDSDISEKQ